MSEPANIYLQSALLRVVMGLEKIIERPQVVAPDQKEVSLENLQWMMNKVIAEMDTLPSDKVNRWVGFVQGVLATQGYLSVQEERDRTREFFHEAYRRAGVEIPPTLERE